MSDTRQRVEHRVRVAELRGGRFWVCSCGKSASKAQPSESAARAAARRAGCA